ncbi:hypothetical protein JGC56_12130 [Salmonella enterica subsp. enterica serovar Saintpaul]|nr:hypothetical protein [Salmonella enterica subsp. enterica serovar Saintpaul]
MKISIVINQCCKWFFLGVCCCFTPAVLPATAEPTASMQESDSEWHKLPSQQFVMFMDNPKFDSIVIYVKKKLKYENKMPMDEKVKFHDENKKVKEFISALKGKITIHHSGSHSLEYEAHFPTRGGDTSTRIYNVNDNYWVGLNYPGFKIKGRGHYVVSAEFYSRSDEFNDYMIGLKKTYGTK